DGSVTVTIAERTARFVNVVAAGGVGTSLAPVGPDATFGRRRTVTVAALPPQGTATDSQSWTGPSAEAWNCGHCCPPQQSSARPISACTVWPVAARVASAYRFEPDARVATRWPLSCE